MGKSKHRGLTHDGTEGVAGKLITACVSGNGDNEGDEPQVLSLGSRIVASGKAEDGACAILDLIKGLGPRDDELHRTARVERVVERSKFRKDVDTARVRLVSQRAERTIAASGPRMLRVSLRLYEALEAPRIVLQIALHLAVHRHQLSRRH